MKYYLMHLFNKYIKEVFYFETEVYETEYSQDGVVGCWEIGNKVKKRFFY